MNIFTGKRVKLAEGILIQAQFIGNHGCIIDKIVARSPLDGSTKKRKMMVSTLPQSEATPTPRAGHSLVKAGSQMVLFGGANHEQGFLSDLHHTPLSPTTLEWSEIKISTTAGWPVGRYEHVCVAIAPNEVLIMYGAGADGPLDDVWVLDLEEVGWRQLQTRGLAPTARVLRSVGFVDGRLYLFGGGSHENVPVPDGGTYCLDIGRLFWAKVCDSGPSIRLGHSMTTIGRKIYLFGGLANETVMNDLWVFDTGKSNH